MRSLDSSATKARLKAVAISHNETLQWLFGSNVVDFPSWLQDSDNSSSSIYWIQGKPGSGKSTLMKFAMMDPRLLNLLQTSERLPYVISGFFFHDRGTLEQNRCPACYRSFYIRFSFNLRIKIICATDIHGAR